MQESYLPVPVIKVDAVARRAPISVPVMTSFGAMKDRPAVFVRVTAADGVSGYGEIWCNFPTVAAEHRQRLAEEVVGPCPCRTRRGGERVGLWPADGTAACPGAPVRRVGAAPPSGGRARRGRRGSRRAPCRPPALSLARSKADGRIRAYASGIGPTDTGAAALSAARSGHTAFKLKGGFGRHTDLRSLSSFRSTMGGEAALMIDSNQGWSAKEAAGGVQEYAEFGLGWIEEPLRADRPIEECS